MFFFVNDYRYGRRTGLPFAEAVNFLGVGEEDLCLVQSICEGAPQSDMKWLLSSPGTGGLGDLWSKLPS